MACALPEKLFAPPPIQVHLEHPRLYAAGLVMPQLRGDIDQLGFAATKPKRRGHDCVGADAALACTGRSIARRGELAK
jgi:hypothetical protein